MECRHQATDISAVWFGFTSQVYKKAGDIFLFPVKILPATVPASSGGRGRFLYVRVGGQDMFGGLQFYKL